jgi:hypothetical protein
MAHPVPTTEPATLVAGDTATWTKSLSDYPASAGWVLSYALVKSGTRITFNASASGDDHLVSEAPVTTAAWAAGDYQWTAKVSLAGAVYTVASGAVTIAADYSAATGGLDARSHARTTLDALEAWIEGRNMGVAEYEIAGRRMKSIPIPDLLVLRDRYRRDVRSEDDAARAAAGLPSRNKMLVRFGKPT